MPQSSPAIPNAVAGVTCCSRIQYFFSSASSSVAPRMISVPGRIRRSSSGRPDRPQPTPDVLGEGQCVVETAAVRGEDDVGVAGREVASLAGVPGLEDDRVALGAAGQGRREVEVELWPTVADLPYGTGCRPGGRARGVGDGSVLPAVPQGAGHGEELLGAPVAVGVVEVAAPPEVRAGQGVVRGHHVPAPTALGQQVQSGEAAREIGGLVEGGVGGADQADPAGDGGQRGKLGDGVRPPGHVEIVDPAVDLPQPESLAEEERVEQASFGGLGDTVEGGGVDLGPALGGGPG